uniref:Homeobox domain-containing protein n=1 Tax=Cricetulus griseus TaxID=10029 RepID=A0A8C2MQI9_CRIGR
MVGTRVGEAERERDRFTGNLERRLRRRQIDFHFTHWQVQEMETVFRETQYPDVLTRRVLARNMNVPEVKVKNWFNNRRAKQRAREKKAMLRRENSNSGPEAPMVLSAGEGREEEESGGGAPGSGSPTSEMGEVEPRETGDHGGVSSAAVTSDLMGDGNPEGASCSSQENGFPPQNPFPESIGDTEGVEPLPELEPGIQPMPVTISGFQPVPISMPHAEPVPIPEPLVQPPVPVLVPRRRLRDRFTGQQLQELERIFQRNRYLTAEEGKQLARNMGVTEAKLQRWFKKKREKFWREHNPSGQSSAPPESESTPP